MQVGSVSHGFGTSRLWHDPNYEISRDYRPQPVQRGITGGEALPKEDHLLPPEKPQDPYSTQEQAYDVAAAQMKRGVEGVNMLQGKNNVAAFDAAVNAAQNRTELQDVTRTQVAQHSVHQQATFVGESMPTGNVRPQQVAPMAAGQVVKPDGATSTASDKEAQQAAKDAKDTSKVLDAVALGAGGVLSVAGALKVAALAPSGAVAAASALGASSAAATTAAGAATLATHDTGEDVLGPAGRSSKQG
jgi:hypothetical protein